MRKPYFQYFHGQDIVQFLLLMWIEIQQYFPIKQSFDNITIEDTELVMCLLNNRP